ncbi:lipoyl(octanoyl) transferase LipB [Lyngbya confervoides]|uniref:Octanoyltransferase n=1 Tax=Lyngbya confervoides BDU141951 TaxID=1574623 RepID=A0ABD4T7Z1_9CYAN|nr:lipoyl(octanoyl) transferase LipB [Lyngbya confervoides]MCM1984671.1 lipoyl(octanoyl) transferase LipB [Lyngbya confervoides BDU141951]
MLENSSHFLDQNLRQRGHTGVLVHTMGRVPFLEVWAWQKHWVDWAIAHPESPDRLLVVEHPPVYTLGTGATLDHLRFDLNHPPAPCHRIERGGEVTYHGPGQLILYPILDLRRYRPDLHWYLRQLEQVVIQLLLELGLRGDRISGLTGVWVAGKKLAAIGIKVRRWVSMHGVALNVCPDLRGFQQIVPCGISDRPVGSLAELIPGITVEQVQPLAIAAFESVFQVSSQWVAGPLWADAFPE